MGRMSRQKGKRGERECAAELSQLLGVPCRRGVQYAGRAAGGAEAPDVIVDADLHVECKRTEALNVYAALHQATEDAPAGKVPMVWHRRNGQPSVVIVETARLVELARAIAKATNG